MVHATMQYMADVVKARRMHYGLSDPPARELHPTPNPTSNTFSTEVLLAGMDTDRVPRLQDDLESCMQLCQRQSFETARQNCAVVCNRMDQYRKDMIGNNEALRDFDTFLRYRDYKISPPRLIDFPSDPRTRVPSMRRSTDQLPTTPPFQ